MSSASDAPAKAATVRLAPPPSLAGFWAGAAAAVAVAGLAWAPGAGESITFLNTAATHTVAAITFAIAAAAGVAAAWIGWAVDSWKRRIMLLVNVLILAGTQSALMAHKFSIAWEPFSFTAAV